MLPPNAASLATIVAERSAGSLSPWIEKHGTSVEKLVHHFSNNSARIMGQPMGPHFWDLALRHNFLVSIMLAVSACHLRYHTPNPAPHHIAELAQESSAIAALKSALVLPLHKDLADALVSTAVMLNAVSFASVVSNSISTSWVFSNSSDTLGWLDLQLQYKNLEKATSQFRESSFLPPSPDAIDVQADDPARAEDMGQGKLPVAWKMMLGDKDTQTFRSYLQPMRTLAYLRYLEPNCYNSFTYFGFLSKLDSGFRGLLFERDPRALWILGYWLGLLDRLKIWWCSRRIERDWTAVLHLLRERELDQRHGNEGQMWQALIADLSVASAWPQPQTENLL